MPTLQQTLANAQNKLTHSASPRLDAEVLLCHVLGVTRSYCYAWPERELSAVQIAQFAALLERREDGEPLAYLLGEREFWSLPLLVSPDVLIPRPDTELLVSIALEKLPPQPVTIIDLGTGSGAIALALAHDRPDCQIIAVDRSTAALNIAQANAQKLALSHIQWQQSHWFSAIKARATLIVSNPPYIAADDPHLNQGDVRFEPPEALVSDQDGLADIGEIIDIAPNYLTNNGWLLLEHGWQQADDVRTLLLAQRFIDVQTWRDLAGHERVSGGRLIRF